MAIAARELATQMVQVILSVDKGEEQRKEQQRLVLNPLSGD